MPGRWSRPARTGSSVRPTRGCGSCAARRRRRPGLALPRSRAGRARCCSGASASPVARPPPTIPGPRSVPPRWSCRRSSWPGPPADRSSRRRSSTGPTRRRPGRSSAAGSSLAARARELAPAPGALVARPAGAPLAIVAEQPDRAAWDRLVGLFAGAVGRGRLDKVVLARRVDARSSIELDVPNALRRLAAGGPESTTFAFARGECDVPRGDAGAARPDRGPGLPDGRDRRLRAARRRSGRGRAPRRRTPRRRQGARGARRGRRHAAGQPRLAGGGAGHRPDARRAAAPPRAAPRDPDHGNAARGGRPARPGRPAPPDAGGRRGAPRRRRST